MTGTANPYEKFVVLIVDDEPHTRSIIKTLLRNIGVRSIVEAGDGKAGLDEVVRTEPHLVLCDVHMEPVDGLAFLRLLRQSKLESMRRTPVVFLTADSKRDTVVFAKEHQVNGYLVKPVSLGGLKARVDAVLLSAV
jgi:two-component system chemotaxis response regulator CheY